MAGMEDVAILFSHEKWTAELTGGVLQEFH